MGMMIVPHKVRDYGQWRPIFDRHAEMQKAAGLINPRVYHSTDSNRSEIVVVFDTGDTKKAKEFASSADLKEAMVGIHPQSIFLNRSTKRSLLQLARRQQGITYRPMRAGLTNSHAVRSRQ
jgi:hypothetical protein